MDALRHRKGACTLKAVNARGQALPGLEIKAALSRHAFLFGCGAFDGVPLLDPQTPPAQKEFLQTLLDAWLELFNFGTLPFYWGRYEKAQGEPAQEATLRAAQWLAGKNIKLKGHPLCWHTHAAPWLLGLPNDQVLSRLLERINREVSAFRPWVSAWDVVNEAVIMPIFTKEDNAITRLCRELGRPGLIRLAFEAARKADPEALLLLNDFDTSDRFEILAEGCLALGVPIGAIGIQSHQHQGFWGDEKLFAVLERFEALGLPLHFTENTFISGDLMPRHIVDLNDHQVAAWPSTAQGEERQARDVQRMLDILFARPSVDCFTVWCIVDGRWLKAPAGLLREDGSKKPAFYALDERVNKDWRTRETLLTNANGEASLEGFLGEYSLEVAGTQKTITLGKETGTVEIALP